MPRPTSDLLGEFGRMPAELEHAIRTRQVVPHFQPLWDLTRGVLVGFEALARWTHPQRGAIAPTVFLACADHVGLTLRLADLLLEQITEARGLFDPRYELLLQINGSLTEMTDPGWAQRVQHLLAVPAHSEGNLVVEISERICHTDDCERATLVKETARALAESSIGIAIDDFDGTTSSRTAVRDIPMTQVKLDRALLGSFPDARRGRFELAARWAHDLGCQVLAEGIERPDQLAVARGARCDLGQGFLLGRPVAAADAAALADSTHRRWSLQA